MPAAVRVKLGGHTWRVVRRTLRKHHGTCDPPAREMRSHSRGREIVLDTALHGRKELEVACHKCLHACAWEVLSEDLVTAASAKFAEIAWRFGCRKYSRDTLPYGLKDLEALLRVVLGGYVWRVADESWVKKSAHDITRALYRFGWRLHESAGKDQA